MKPRYGWLFLPLALLVTGCSTGGSNKVELKDSSETTSMEVLSGSFNSETMSGSAATYIYLFNNKEGKANKDKGQIRLYLSLRGKTGTTKADPKLVGVYSPGKGADMLEEMQFEKGQGTSTKDTVINVAQAKGSVEITSATKEQISGKIDVVQGDIAVKGSFTAKQSQ